MFIPPLLYKNYFLLSISGVLAVADQTADGISFFVKFLLIFRHDIIWSRTVRVEIKAAFVEDPSGIPDLLQGKIKEGTVIRLKLDKAILCQKAVIPFEKLA